MIITPDLREQITAEIAELHARGGQNIHILLEDGTRSTTIPVVIGRWKEVKNFRFVQVEQCAVCGTKNRAHGSGGPKASICDKVMRRVESPEPCPGRSGYWVYVADD